jgi:hypothetical protein
MLSQRDILPAQAPACIMTSRDGSSAKPRHVMLPTKEPLGKGGNEAHLDQQPYHGLCHRQPGIGIGQGDILQKEPASMKTAHTCV